MSNLYREPSIDASYQVSLHLVQWFQRRRFFRNRPIRNKNCLWWPCLLMDWDKMSNLYRGPSIDASYQIPVNLGKWFQRRRFFQKSTNQKQEWPVAAMFVIGSELNEHSLQSTFQGCFLPSFDSFVHAVSEEKIFQKSTNQKQEWIVVAMFVNGSGRNEQSLQRTFHRCFLPSFSSFGQAVSEEKIFLNRSFRNKNCLWWPCLLMDRDKMSNLYRGPSIDSTYQISVH